MRKLRDREFDLQKVIRREFSHYDTLILEPKLYIIEYTLPYYVYVYICIYTGKFICMYICANMYIYLFNFFGGTRV
jgi:hypothetical protein